MTDWNSNQYTKFLDERTQPVIDLIKKIPFVPQTVLDIGCGPGNSTNQLSNYFPKADITGVDSSLDMLDKANKNYPFLKFGHCIVPKELDKFGNYDLIFSNACLHWIPDHKNLFKQLTEKLNSGGALAVQMPVTEKALFYIELKKMLALKKWKSLQSINCFYNLSSFDTYNVLTEITNSVIMWETIYYHKLNSYTEILEWYKGTGLRPYLNSLSPSEKEEFLNELSERIKKVYLPMVDGSFVLQMPRLFFIAFK